MLGIWTNHLQPHTLNLKHGIANPTQQFTEEETEAYGGESPPSVHPT
jgi:hypothetical protein